MTSFFNDLSDMHNESYPALNIFIPQPKIFPIEPIEPIEPNEPAEPTQLIEPTVAADPLIDAVLLVVKSMDRQKQISFLLSNLTETLNKSNLAKLWNITVVMLDDQLNLFFLEYLQKNINDCDEKIIREFSPSVIKLIVGSKLNPLSELEIFIIASKWIKQNEPDKEFIQQLLSNINFPEIGSKNLVKIVRPIGLIDDQQCFQAIIDSHDDAKIINRKFASCKIGIGYVNKSYPAFRPLKVSELTDSNLLVLFNAEFKKYNGFRALETILLPPNNNNREIRVDNQCITFNDGGVVRLYKDNNALTYRKGDVCEISFSNGYKNNETEITKINKYGRESNCDFSFFVNK